eukprot:7388474-Prymnesium_polylepis.1
MRSDTATTCIRRVSARAKQYESVRAINPTRPSAANTPQARAADRCAQTPSVSPTRAAGAQPLQAAGDRRLRRSALPPLPAAGYAHQHVCGRRARAAPPAGADRRAGRRVAHAVHRGAAGALRQQEGRRRQAGGGARDLVSAR